MTLEELITDVDRQAIESIKERINACERKKYTSGVVYWRYKLESLLEDIRYRKERERDDN